MPATKRNTIYEIRDQARANGVKKAKRNRDERERPLVPDPVTTDREYAPEEFEFLAAVTSYQKRTSRRFLTACEYLAVAKQLGYCRP